MMRALLPGILTFCAASIVGGALLAGPDQVALPENYRTEFVNYLDVDRIDRKRVRKMYVSPAAHGSAQAGADLPDGTVLIMEDHDAATDANGDLVRDADGRLVALEPVLGVFVMERNAAWSTDNGHWDYAWYEPDGAPRENASFDGCFACHNNRSERDYTFTFWKFVSDRPR